VKRTIRAGAIAAALAATPAAAQVTVTGNVAYDSASPSWSQARTFTEFLEDARYDSRLETDPGLGFDLGIQVTLFRGVGPVLAFSRVSRDATGSLNARVPHPFFFDQDRTASVDLTGFQHSEQAVHMGLGWQGENGALAFAVFGGLSLFKVEADAVATVDYDQTYPFDEITLRSPRPERESDQPTGFHIGGRLDWKLTRSVGVGAQARFSSATARFAPSVGDAFEIDAGGLQFGAGLRIYF